MKNIKKIDSKINKSISFLNKKRKRNKKKLEVNVKNKNIRKNKANKIFKSIKNPKNIKLLNNITNNSFVNVAIDNTFIVFNSVNNILYLIFVHYNMLIICYDLNAIQKVCEIDNHEYISGFRHYLDKSNKRDLIMVLISSNCIKIWNAKNFECLLYIQNINPKGYLYSACFLKDSNQIYIVTSNMTSFDCEAIKVYDLNGNIKKEINNSNDSTYFLDIFYDNKSLKKYIIVGCFGFVKSYDYSKNELYNKYLDNLNEKKPHCSIVINNNKKITKLMESCDDGIIRIWNFHSGALLKKINISEENNSLFGICLWNKDYLFVGCKNNAIKLIELKSGLIIKNINSHYNGTTTIKKIKHPKYGEILISQGYIIDQIKLWN